MARKSEIWFARLKPHRQGGHKCKRYSIDGIRFVLNKGWTRVSERMAEELIEKRSGHAHDAPLLFDIKTAAEADAMDRRERRANKPSRPEESSLIAVGRGDAPDVEDLPIADYGALSVRKVKARLAGLDHEALLEILA
ncbi:MAG: hypothetical protein KAJ19_10780 [Gammaproteobacteria bacterium]|nr:hypothetical protein [Gammaproteobacteria bacterium]